MCWVEVQKFKIYVIADPNPHSIDNRDNLLPQF